MRQACDCPGSVAEKHSLHRLRNGETLGEPSEEAGEASAAEIPEAAAAAAILLGRAPSEKKGEAASADEGGAEGRVGVERPSRGATGATGIAEGTAEEAAGGADEEAPGEADDEAAVGADTATYGGFAEDEAAIGGAVGKG